MNKFKGLTSTLLLTGFMIAISSSVFAEYAATRGSGMMMSRSDARPDAQFERGRNVDAPYGARPMYQEVRAIARPMDQGFHTLATPIEAVDAPMEGPGYADPYIAEPALHEQEFGTTVVARPATRVVADSATRVVAGPQATELVPQPYRYDPAHSETRPAPIYRSHRPY